jgi:hypothetical protein
MRNQFTREQVALGRNDPDLVAPIWSFRSGRSGQDDPVVRRVQSGSSPRNPKWRSLTLCAISSPANKLRFGATTRIWSPGSGRRGRSDPPELQVTLEIGDQGPVEVG